MTTLTTARKSRNMAVRSLRVCPVAVLTAFTLDPVLGLRKLKKPLSISVIKEKYGFAPPQGWMYAPLVLVEGEVFEEMEVII